MVIEIPSQPEKENNKEKRLLDILSGSMNAAEREEAQSLAREIIAEKKHLEELVTIDELTELKNRRGFEQEVGKVFLQVTERDKADKPREHIKIDDLSIVFIDIDNFKLINDTAGHEVGDLVLQKVSAKLREVFRESDHFGRWGGEEFVVGMVGANEKDAVKKAERLRRLLAEIKIPEHAEIKISASIGIASIGDSQAENFEQLIKFADKAMYKAKNSGKDKVVAFNQMA